MQMRNKTIISSLFSFFSACENNESYPRVENESEVQKELKYVSKCLIFYRENSQNVFESKR